MYRFAFHGDWQYHTLNRNLLCGLAILKVRKTVADFSIMHLFYLFGAKQTGKEIPRKNNNCSFSIDMF